MSGPNTGPGIASMLAINVGDQCWRIAAECAIFYLYRVRFASAMIKLLCLAFAVVSLSGCGLKCEHDETVIFNGQSVMKYVEDEYGNREMVPHRCIRGVWKRIDGSSAKVID